MHDWSISPYATTVAVLGLVMVAAAWLPRLLAGRAITFPLLYVAAGAGLFALPLDLPRLEPLEVGTLTLHLTELVVIISLMSAGLKLDRAVSLRGWMTTWRLLAITMPLTIALIAGLGVWGLGWALPAAVLLGAVLAPTDPVLASEVQVESPEEEHEDQVRFSLTSEAGLNDGLAFPFTWLAIGLALHGGQAGDWAWEWFLVDVLYRIVVGFVGGWAVGWALARLLFRPPKDGSEPVAQAMEGSLALAATFAAYGLVEMISGYGFIAVFVAAYALRRHEMDHEAHVALHTFTEDIERVLMAVVLVLVGGAAWNVLGHLTWAGGAVAVAIVLVVRPLAGVVGLLGRDEPWRERLAIAFFGIRGIGSLFYLAYALTHAQYPEANEIWAVTLTVILLSALVHGLTASPVMQHLDARNEYRERGST